MTPLDKLKHHVTGAIERGEAQAIAGIPAKHNPFPKISERYGTVLRIYDNGGKTFDRYTIIPPRWAKQYKERSGLFEAIGASEYPFSPQGFGMHVSAMPGAHLGKRIKWADLPEDVQRFARQSFPEFDLCQ